MLIPTHTDHVADIALWSSELSGFFGLDVDNEVEVVPQTVLLFDVLLKCHLLVLKLASLQS